MVYVITKDNFSLTLEFINELEESRFDGNSNPAQLRKISSTCYEYGMTMISVTLLLKDRSSMLIRIKQQGFFSRSRMRQIKSIFPRKPKEPL